MHYDPKDGDGFNPAARAPTAEAKEILELQDILGNQINALVLERDHLRAGLESIVNCARPLTRAAVREACAEILASSPASQPFDTPAATVPSPANLADFAELKLLIDEYDPSNSDWNFRRNVLLDILVRIWPRESFDRSAVIEECAKVADTVAKEWSEDADHYAGLQNFGRANTSIAYKNGAEECACEIRKLSAVTRPDHRAPARGERNIETEHFHYDAATRTLTEK